MSATEQFENYKTLHDFQYPDEPLKAWINEDNFNDLYIESWDCLMDIVEMIKPLVSESEFTSRIGKHLNNLDRAEVHNGCVQFIKEHTTHQAERVPRANTIKRIQMFLDVYNQEALDTIELLLETYSNSVVGKGDIMKLVLTDEEYKKCDSALPQDYVKTIQEVLPSFNTFSNVFDYNTKSFGEVRNIAEDLHKLLHTKLNQSNFIKQG